MRILRLVQSLTLLAFFGAFVGIIFPTNLHSQEMMIDVIHLKNGSIVRGIIIEQVPGVSYKIETSDRSVFFYPHSDVEKITKERVVLATQGDERSPTLAFLASFFIPGLGQILVNEDYLKGIGFFVGSSVGIGIMAYCASNNYDGAYVGAILSIGCSIGSWIEAPIAASSYNKKLRASRGIRTVSFSPTINQFGVEKEILSYGVSFKLNF